jgi:CRP-like cAMP-binding protein
MAPRSASIKALIPTQFWCITRNTFRQTVEEYVKKNYAIAKEYVDKFPLFASLTEKQRDSVAYNMLTLKY